MRQRGARGPPPRSRCPVIAALPRDGLSSLEQSRPASRERLGGLVRLRPGFCRHYHLQVWACASTSCLPPSWSRPRRPPSSRPPCVHQREGRRPAPDRASSTLKDTAQCLLARFNADFGPARAWDKVSLRVGSGAGHPLTPGIGTRCSVPLLRRPRSRKCTTRKHKKSSCTVVVEDRRRGNHPQGISFAFARRRSKKRIVSSELQGHGQLKDRRLPAATPGRGG